MIRAGIYSRVSTDRQQCEGQIAELEAYCVARGWQVTERYTDIGISGAKASRPALNRLMADARSRKLDAVVVVKLDRFGRSLIDCVTAIQELQALGVRFVATTQGIDTDQSNPASTLLMHLLAAIAAFERELIKERTRSGIANARAKGKTLGRPQRIYDRGRAQEMRAAGASFGMIARILGVPKSTIAGGMAK